MSEIRLSGEYLNQGYTSVNNAFLQCYLPEADAVDVKIYLYGLKCACLGEDCSVKTIAEKLSLSENRVVDGYRYWAEKGLVHISSTEPVSVTYLSVREPEPAVIKVHAEKYKVFTEEASRIYPDRLLMPNDLNAYIELMHSEKMETNAMLLVMQYCKDLGGGKTGTKYVCAVARAWAKEGFLTEKQVASHISDLENNNEEIRQIFEALGIKRSAEIEDRQMYFKWRGYGLSQEALLVAARSRKKKGGMDKLDEYVEELRRGHAVTPQEVALYCQNKEKIHNLAVEICKNLGVYYSNTENITEEYIVPWINRGFEQEALLRISKYCFLRNVHTFDVMRQMVEKIASVGLFTESEITQYVEKQIAIDKKVREIFELAGHIGPITNRDRDNYRVYLEWGYDEETIKEVAKSLNGTSFPMQNMNRIMGSLHNCNILGKENVLAFLKKSNDKKQVDDYQKHQYTDEELQSALINFDNWE